MKQTNNPENIHQPVGPYVHQVISTGESLKWLTLSGQIGMTIDKEIPVKAEEQFALALQNIEKNLVNAQMTTDDIVKLTIYLVEPIELEIRTKLLNNFLKKSEVAMTLLYVKGLANPKLKAEIDVVACQ